MFLVSRRPDRRIFKTMLGIERVGRKSARCRFLSCLVSGPLAPLRSILLFGVAGAALLAAVGDAGAAQLYWNTNAGTTNGYNKVGKWLTGTNVSSGTAPTAADTVNISAGSAALAAPGVADTVNLNGTGLFDIGHNGVLNAST